MVSKRSFSLSRPKTKRAPRLCVEELEPRCLLSTNPLLSPAGDLLPPFGDQLASDDLDNLGLFSGESRQHRSFAGHVGGNAADSPTATIGSTGSSAGGQGETNGVFSNPARSSSTSRETSDSAALFLAASIALGRSPSKLLPNTRPGSGGAAVTTFAGPDVSVTIGLAGPSTLPVNADDDNGSAVTNGIPTTRDFSINPMPGGKADPDILPYTVNATGAPPGGTWDWTLIQTGGGKVSLWKDAMKSASISAPNGVTTITFSVEGGHESTAAGDISLQFAYTVNGTIYHSNTLTITVTPLVNTFTVTPGADAGDPTGQNVRFDNGVDGSTGLQARTPKGVYGATFKGVAVKSGLNGTLAFVQNFLDEVNGNHGTKNGLGTLVGWLYQNNTGQRLKLKNPGGFPILDVDAASGDQTYTLRSSVVSPDQTTITILSDDSPRTGNPDGGAQGIAVDTLDKIQLYLVWEWKQVASNSGGTQVPVFYFLAYNKWQVDFWGIATNDPLTGPITKIQVLNGVKADTAYTASNLEPPQAALNTTRTTTTDLKWVAAQ